MQQRRVTGPDGQRWIIGRRWLLGRPGYFGFRFGVDSVEPEFEPARKRPQWRVERWADRLSVERKPAPTKPPTSPPVRYRNRHASGGFWGRGLGRIFTGGGGVGGRRSSGSSGSSGGGSRGRASGGGRRSRSSGGGRRGGGGAAGGILTALATFLKYAVIVVAVILAALLLVFVLIPSLVFLIQYAAFWIVIGVTIAYRTATKRPWIVEMEEADGFRVRAWRIVGWRASRKAIDAVADAIRRGDEPSPADAEPVEIVNEVEPA